ncbi:MAG: putative DNA binding domain-containing protein [Deltaproteobacteria bacterium]|nr:putative DNA binding domain-containing protein [Deltaproteobacteria bacterium]
MRLQERIKALVEEGEGYLIEFKEAPNDLERDICAFANGSGGSLYLGITDQGNLKPIKLSNRLRAQLQSMARNLDPPQEILVQPFGPLIQIRVKESENKPVRAPGGFYLRVGAISQKLSREEILAFAIKENRIYFDQQLYVEADARDFLNIRQVELFRKKAGLEAEIDNLQLLENLGCLKMQQRRPCLTFGAILLFGKDPQKIFPQATLTLLRLSDPADIQEQKILKGTLFQQVEEAFDFLKSELLCPPRIKGLLREEQLEFPEPVLRELLVNAIIHRDYFERSADVVVKIFPSYLEFSNPGTLNPSLSFSQIYGRSFRRNPLIADLFYRARYIERAGTGLLRVRQILQQEGLPPLTLSEEGPFFIATLTRGKEPKEKSRLNERQMAFLNLKKELFPLSTADYARRFQIGERMARMDIQDLIQQGLLKIYRKGRHFRYGPLN